ncbi:site-specific DNA-methyltransferase [candidate division WOR-3 bacterium]|nr:site-specific DNA-methyltransferase [candidate division WOR-3 bacterium]
MLNERVEHLLSMNEAIVWASRYLSREVTKSNIAYLLQYGKVRKITDNGAIFVSQYELKKYYDSFHGKREIQWKDKLGQDLNWHLSFDHLREKDTTKHVHRLHPYKGKFIPQLVEYFLDNHTDKFKKEVYFKKGDIVLDPFCGSGTALVQANELGLHAIGIDISPFNVLISNVKIAKYDLPELRRVIYNITEDFKSYIANSNSIAFENKLLEELAIFNNKYFPTPDFKFRLNRKEINEKKYGKEKEKEFLPIYNRLVNEYKIKLKQDKTDNFLDIWYLYPVRQEINYIFEKIKKIENINVKKILAIILSRTIRSCRATTHSDLATLKEPVFTTYYCTKHKKICKPLFSIYKWWDKYTKDTIQRILEFNLYRTDSYQICLTGDSRTINILRELEKKNPIFAELAKKQVIRGILTSPPYVGLINYHEQHAYAYDLFGFSRSDKLEIGPLFRGSGVEARESYVQGIIDVLNNCKKFLVDDFDIFLIANDKYNLYPTIAEKSRMQIVNRYKRPVLNRTERDKGAYSEIIFHLKSSRRFGI